MASSFVVPLPLPRHVDLTRGGDSFDLVIQEGHTKIVPWAETATYGYSGSLLGPVVRVKSGQNAKARISNKLPMESSVHWHGLFVPSDVDGQFNPIAIGDIWSPTLKINQPAATTWFHPHPHGNTARQTYMGLAGPLHVDDGSAEAFNLPRDYGIDDIPIILQDRSVGKDGQLGINGQTYEMNRIDIEVAFGSQEIWEIVSSEMAHPFHIHGATFQTLKKSGKAVRAHESGIKATVLVENKAEVLVSFRQPSTREKPFVFHCHILEHEDWE